MHERVARRLRLLNRRFYERYASDFDHTRQRPWRGWEELLEIYSPPVDAAPRVLDVGCGNGRFATFLGARWQRPMRYLGIDECAALLDLARERVEPLAGDFELRQVDILDQSVADQLAGQRFDLVVLFGVLHHVPSVVARRTVLEDLGRCVAPGGTLAVSIWRLDQTPRLARQQISWPHRGEDPIAPSDVEAGDTLLGWAGVSEHPRYCHFPSDDEIESWIDLPGLPNVERFSADGPTGSDNLYLVFRD